MKHNKIARAIKLSNGMNSLEAQYAETLESMKREGDIVWYAFEPVKLKLADKTHYIPDFMVQTADSEIEIHEVKGFWREDARVKIKVAASIFPFRFLAVTPIPKSKGGGWNVEYFTKEENYAAD